MDAASCRLGLDDVIVGLDLATVEHQAVVVDADGRRLARFRVPHSRKGINELLKRTAPALLNRPSGHRIFAFEATGHTWEALAFILQEHGERYVLVNPLATFRVREARQMDRHKTDVTDAEQIAELMRNGIVTRTQLESGPYVELRRTWGEYARLRDERALALRQLDFDRAQLADDLLGRVSLASHLDAPFPENPVQTIALTLDRSEGVTSPPSAALTQTPVHHR